MNITIWRVEFCHSTLGIYDYQWFATESEAQACIQELVDKELYELVDEPTGEDCTVTSKPDAIEVDLTLEGLLSFANEYAIDTGAY